jgi:hypothetical protein
VKALPWESGCPVRFSLHAAITTELIAACQVDTGATGQKCAFFSNSNKKIHLDEILREELLLALVVTTHAMALQVSAVCYL